MFLKDIQVLSFRNYDNVYFKPHPQMNIFYGQNAQGKTNLLEAIYFLLRAKSFRTQSDRQAIQFTKDHSFIRGRVESFGFDYIHEIKLSRSLPKVLRINEETIDSSQNYRQANPVVVFRPEDILMVKEGPDLRRDYLDSLLDQVDGSYGQILKNYNQLLYQRNLNLKQANDKTLLDIYDHQLSQLGSRLILKRQDIVEKLKPLVKAYYEKISQGGLEEVLDISYKTDLNTEGPLDQVIKTYRQLLQGNREKDLDQRTTSFGPHREDLYIGVSQKPARTYASQGQQRSIVLAFKLAELDVIKNLTRQGPVLLLDDVFSELDQGRQDLFFQAIKDCQSFITTTDYHEEALKQRQQLSLYKIENQQVIKRKE